MSINQKLADSLRKALAISQKGVKLLICCPFDFKTADLKDNDFGTQRPINKDSNANIHEQANTKRAASKNSNPSDFYE